MDLTEADDIKKRWQEYTEDVYKSVLNDPDNHGVVITQLEQTYWSTKSNGHQETSLQTTLVEVMDFHVNN